MSVHVLTHISTHTHAQSVWLLFSLGISLQPPSSSVLSLTASGVFELQFTASPSIHCFLNYAILSAMRMHRSDKQHTAFLLPLHFHSLSRSSSRGFALTGRHNQYLIYPSPAQRWGETRLRLCGFPHVNPLEQQRLDSCCWCPCWALDYFTSYFFKLSPTPS